MSGATVGNRRGRVRHTLLAMGLMAALGSGPLWAQSITGGLYGSEPAGKAATISVDNAATGYHKSLQAGADGRYSLAGLNPGRYTVTVEEGGSVVGTRTVTVTANVQTPVPALTTAAAATAGVHATELGAVQVDAAALRQDVIPIDVSTPEFSNSYDMSVVNQLPTGRGPESIALLSSKVRYDNQTTDLIQMGGASPAENRYYYNEFDSTYDYQGLGATYLPAEAVQSTQVLSSNAGVTWTSTTGGLMASTVRQGSNRFKAGYSLYFTPATSWFNPRARDSLTAQGDYYQFNSANTHSANVTGQYLWASGALVKNRLFFFAMLGNAPDNTSVSNTQTLHTETARRDKNGLLNLTWNINADQSLNVVGYRDWKNTFNNQYSLERDYDPSSVGPYYGWTSEQVKNQFLIGNYHWQINEDMSLRLMGGYLSQSSLKPTSTSGSGLPYVGEVDPATQVRRNIGLTTSSTQLFPFDYWRRGFKGDFTWQLGDHRITVGGEHYKHYINNVSTTTEGGDWTYHDEPGTILPNGSPAPANGRYVDQYFVSTGGPFFTVNKAAYLEDYWQASDRWVVYAGARYDTFINKNVNGQNFFHLPLLSPRFGVAWDVYGDSTMKIGANAGKYTIPIPSSVNNGAAGAVTMWHRYYTYTGRDPSTQAPQGLTQIGPQETLINGQAPSAYNVATSDIKAPYQYEFQVYLQKTLGQSWSSLVEVGYSSLKRAIEDTCYTQGITDYAQANGYPGYEDSSGCPMINPGVAQTFVRDYDGDGKVEALTLPGSVFGPPPSRKYVHLTVELSHARNSEEPYFLDLSYTWAHLYGNYDGLLNLGTRTDGGPSEQIYWDFPGLMEHGNGNLAGDVRHSVKLNGVYYFANGLRVGSTLDLSTGTPQSCMGTYPDIDNPAEQYGAASHFCDNVPSPLGSAGRMPFFAQWNVGVGYDWQINQDNFLSLDLQVQNLTNREGRIDANQRYDTGGFQSDGQPIPNPSYNASVWQAPRTTSLVVRYTFQ